MAYTVVDLLAKLIIIEENACKIYKNIAASTEAKERMYKNAASVLAKEEERHVEFYRQVKLEAENQEAVEIDFAIYDKASALIQEFKRRLARPYVVSARDLLKFALGFEKENVALLLDIQGRLVQKDTDTETVSYKTFLGLIEEEQKHIRNLEAFIGDS